MQQQIHVMLFSLAQFNIAYTVGCFFIHRIHLFESIEKIWGVRRDPMLLRLCVLPIWSWNRIQYSTLYNDDWLTSHFCWKSKVVEWVDSIQSSINTSHIFYVLRTHCIIISQKLKQYEVACVTHTSSISIRRTLTVSKIETELNGDGKEKPTGHQKWYSVS